MKLSGFLCVFLISFFITSDFVTLSCCLTVADCPVRAVPVSTPEVEEGFICACMRDFYGTNCRFKARNKSLLEVDGHWLSEDTASLTWTADYGANFHLSVRRVQYDLGAGIVNSKWKPAMIKSLNVYSSDASVLASDIPVNFTAKLRLNRSENFELYLTKVTSTGEVNGSVSLFLDAENTIDVKNMNKSIEEICTWYKCPGKFFHVTQIMEDFGSSCFVHGAIVAVLVTIVGIVVIGIFIYVILRLCKRTRNQKSSIAKPTINENSSGAELSVTQSKVVQKTSSLNSCVIDILDLSVDSYPICDGFTEKNDSVSVTIDDMIKDINPPSVHWTDDETLSDSGSSFTTVTTLSHITSLEDEGDLPNGLA